MVEKAVVSRVEKNGLVRVILCPDEACESCAACAAFDRNKPQVVKTSNPGGLPLKSGDFVEVYMATGRTIKAAFMVLILPLICFFALYMGSGRLGLGSEAARVLLGAAGLAAVFGYNYLRRGNPKDLPQVLRVTPAPYPGT
jgi:positive regulator of sigma E activity